MDEHGDPGGSAQWADDQTRQHLKVLVESVATALSSWSRP